jgi:TPR repeat protein
LHLRAAAENNYLPAYNLLGVLLLSKKLSGRNPAEAWTWLEKSASEGIREAKINQATYLKRGENGTVDYQQAYAILELLAHDKEDEIASYLLALLILSGGCAVTDQNVARRYLEISAQKGWQPASKLLDNDDLFGGSAVLNFWEDYMIEPED